MCSSIIILDVPFFKFFNWFKFFTFCFHFSIFISIIAQMGPGDAMGRRLDRTPWSYEQPVSDATAGDGTPCTTGSPSLTAKTQNGSPFVISSPSAYQAPRAVGSFGQVLTAHERKGRHGCTAIRLLVFLLFFFVCLSCVTIAIILWMGEPCARGQHEEQPTASETVKVRVPDILGWSAVLPWEGRWGGG